jgi:hypothetical protein
VYHQNVETPTAARVEPSREPAALATTESGHAEHPSGTSFSSHGAIPPVAPAPSVSGAPSASDQAFGAATPAVADDANLTQVAVKRVVDGVTVFAPPGTHLAAMDQCAQFITQEIGRNQYAQQSLAKARATIVIIPAHTPMTDVPQFAGMRGGKTFDGRDWSTVRGSGGIQAPDGSFAIGVAEENLVAVKGVVSGYPTGYSIGMHEFAHAVNSHGMTPAQQKRLDQLYAQHIAKDPGDAKDTFTDRYASSNSQEYWAQATNAFFGKNEMPTQNNHDGRAWLQANDPDLYAFLVEMYDTDRNVNGDAIAPKPNGARDA